MDELRDVLFSGGVALAGIALTIISVALRKAGPLLADYVSAWIRAKIDEIEDGRTRQRVQQAREAVADAVKSVAQDVVPEIRKAASDGKFSSEERDRLRTTALTRTKKAFGADFWERLETVIPDLDTWLLDQIEARVGDLKVPDKIA